MKIIPKKGDDRMNDKDWIKYCEERKIAIEKEIERLKREIVYLKGEIEFFDRQIERLKGKSKELEGGSPNERI